MTDIVKRLREWAKDGGAAPSNTCLEAADTIKRLRAENAELREMLRAAVGSYTTLRIDPIPCQKCGQPYLSIPRMGLVHICHSPQTPVGL